MASDAVEVVVVGTIERGSVLFVTEDSFLDAEGERHGELVKALAVLAGHDEFLLLIGSPGETIEMADEDTMRQAGWGRLRAVGNRYGRTGQAS